MPRLTLVDSLLWVHAGAPSIPIEIGDSSELRKHKHHFDKAAVQLQGRRPKKNPLPFSSSSMTCEPALKLQAINSHPIKTLYFLYLLQQFCSEIWEMWCNSRVSHGEKRVILLKHIQTQPFPGVFPRQWDLPIPLLRELPWNSKVLVPSEQWKKNLV